MSNINKRKPDEGYAGDGVAAEAADRAAKAREKPLACDGVNCNNVCTRLSIYENANYTIRFAS